MNQVYQWVDWFEELAQKIADNDHEYLITRGRNVELLGSDDDRTEHPLFTFGDAGVDPFSFIYTVASKATVNQFKRVFASINDVFELTRTLNLDHFEDQFLFPIPSGQNTLFHRGDEFKPAILRELFVKAVTEPNSVDDSFFEKAFAVKGVGLKNLTQALFLVSPKSFFPIDDGFHEIFGHMFSLPKKDKTKFRWSDYSQFLERVKHDFNCELYELNLWVYMLSAKHLVGESTIYYQVTLEESKETLWEEWRAESYVRINQLNRDFARINRGDVILVRQGSGKNKGIGLILSKKSVGTSGDGSILHVAWMNKRETFSETQYLADEFSQDGRVEELFRKEDAYKLNFDILDRFASSEASNEPFVDVDPDRKTHYPLNQIFFGPPGTGKTFAAEETAVKIIDGDQDDKVNIRDRYQQLCNEKRIKFVTFHQNYAYEDFIEGIRPRLEDRQGENKLEYERKDGLFKELCKEANDKPDKNYVLIIDEINRGNISKIFGELITLIEDSRRLSSQHPTQATLAISNHRFGVPGNLYIIGTMNTADRSIQLLDTALRRRFHFEELMPNPSHSELSHEVDGINLSELMTTMNERIAALLDREHQIGHTNFFDVNTVGELAFCFKFNVFPLLQEYFFDDWAKIKIVLGNNDFVLERDIEHLNLGEEFEEHGKIVYERISLDDETWTNPDQYKKIYE